MGSICGINYLNKIINPNNIFTTTIISKTSNSTTKHLKLLYDQWYSKKRQVKTELVQYFRSLFFSSPALTLICTVRKNHLFSYSHAERTS